MGISRSNLEAVLVYAVNDPTNSIGGLNDMGDVLLLQDRLLLLLELYEFGGKLELLVADLEADLAVRLHRCTVFFKHCFFEVLEVFTDWFCIPLEGLSYLRLIQSDTNELDELGLLEWPGSIQLHLSPLGVPCQIEARPVGVACYLDPPIARLNFSIPAVLRIMSHLVAPVLPEPNTIWLDTTVRQELPCSNHEVSQRLIADNTLGNSFTHREIVAELS